MRTSHDQSEHPATWKISAGGACVRKTRTLMITGNKRNNNAAVDETSSVGTVVIGENER
jgi:hypothetical protein